jgi:hypothetical protein
MNGAGNNGKLISIIIVNYFQKEFITGCVRSITNRLNAEDYELIAVNNSPAEDLGSLKEIAPGISIIENSNRGFPQANNLAAKYATGRYLLFLNPDTLVEDDFIEEFRRLKLPQDFGIGGLRLYNPDGSVQLSYWKENTFMNEIRNKSDEKQQRDRSVSADHETFRDGIAEVDWVSGASMLIERELFMETGGFDEHFFLFYEDADICKRVHDYGRKILYLPAGKIIHYKGENVNEKFSSDTYYYTKESQLYYYSKHNRIADRSLLRAYLFLKFTVRYFRGFRKIDKDILKLLLGKRRNDART